MVPVMGEQRSVDEQAARLREQAHQLRAKAERVEARAAKFGFVLLSPTWAKGTDNPSK